MRTRRTMLPGVLSALILTLTACGGDDGATDTSSSAAESSDAEPAPTSVVASPVPASGDGPEETMRAYFDAIVAGDTATICDLEDDTLEVFKYDETGEACLEDLANQNAQPAFTTGAQVTIVTEDVTETQAIYSVTTPSGAGISVGLELVDGRWLMHVFT